MKPAGHFKYDENGVPVLAKAEIESIADTVREWGGHQDLSQTGQTEVLGIYTKLQETGQLLFRYEYLNEPSVEAKVLGKFRYGTPPVIILDVEHENSSSHARTRFTLAHELGHFSLHRHRVIRKKKELIDTDENLPRNLGAENEAPDWAEWQANFFAGALLLPMKTIGIALAKYQQACGIRKNVGVIYLDDSSFSHRDFHQALEHLRYQYSVSKTVVEIRVRQLDLIRDHRSESSSTMTKLGDLLT